MIRRDFPRMDGYILHDIGDVVSVIGIRYLLPVIASNTGKD